MLISLVDFVLLLFDVITGKRHLKVVLTDVNLIYGVRRSTSRKSYIYVGKSTLKNFKTRQNTHLRKSLNGTHANKRLMKEIRNSRRNPRKSQSRYDIRFDVLETCSERNVFQREAYHIEKHSSKKLTNIIRPKYYT